MTLEHSLIKDLVFDFLSIVDLLTASARMFMCTIKAAWEDGRKRKGEGGECMELWVRWNLTVVLICISFIVRYVEHFFMCFSAIWTSSFEKAHLLISSLGH
jgi:hypothetical protein